MTEWPALALSDWDDTRATFHMWTQIVGKIRLGLEPMVNHWWQVALYVSGRGWTTSLMPTAQGGLEIELDVVDDVVQLRSTDGRVRHVAMEPRTVASFYADIMQALDALDVSVRISPRPNEVVDAIPFPDDQVHRAYDGEAVRTYWRQLVHAHRVMQRFRGEFIGKCSPVHYFWGAPDLAVTRFSGRVAPRHAGGVPNCPDDVQVEAYSHEVSSAGFWAGGGNEGAFYSYAYPAPDGFAQWRVQPDAARYDDALGEFILPYEAVRTAPDPDAFLLEFLRSTYVAAAELAGWDRAALEASWARD